jgi:glyoxylase I family protein
MELANIHHIAINVSDYDRSKEFYVSKLGFRILGEYIFPSGTRRMDCVAGQIRLEIFCNTGKPGAFVERNIGYRHLCFHAEDIETAVAELRTMDIPVEEIRSDMMSGGRMAFIRDPDDIIIELHE